MKIIKKKWLKTPLVIDFRPAQSLNYNGVTIATVNWIQELIRISKKDQPIYIWTNSKSQKPKLPFSKKNIIHIHTNHSNLKLQLLWFFNLGPNLSKILNIRSQFILFSPDLRSIKYGNKCLKHIQYIHDIAFLKLKNTLTTKTKLWFFLTKPKKQYSKANLILTNSEFTKEEITKQFGKQNIKIVHPTIPKKLPTKIHPHPSNYHLIISTIQKRKNLISTIQHFNQKQKNLVIIGNKEKMFKQYNLKNNKNLTIYSNISNEEKNFLIKNSIATVYPSCYEGFGLPILESIRLKKPVLTYSVKPYTQLFYKQTTDLNNLFLNQFYKTPTKQNLYSLKKETRKLKRLIYALD